MVILLTRSNFNDKEFSWRLIQEFLVAFDSITRRIGVNKNFAFSYEDIIRSNIFTIWNFMFLQRSQSSTGWRQFEARGERPCLLQRRMEIGL